MLDIEEIARVFARHGVRCIVVGGTAVIAHGLSDYQTEDVDLLFDGSLENRKRLARALEELDARPRRLPPHVPSRIDAKTLLADDPLLLESRAGRVDLMSEIAGIGGYEEAAQQAERFRIGKQEVTFLSLDGLIRSKEAAGRRRDEQVLPALRALRSVKGVAPTGANASSEDAALAAARAEALEAEGLLSETLQIVVHRLVQLARSREGKSPARFLNNASSSERERLREQIRRLDSRDFAQLKLVSERFYDAVDRLFRANAEHDRKRDGD